MANLITVKVDVTKLDKARFFRGKPDQSGHAPLYADLILVPRREPGRFGDTHIVKQSKRKEEAVEMPILGNATERGGQPSAPQPRPTPAPQDGINDEDVPF